MCPWYSRWFHRQARATDRTFMLPAILRAASNPTYGMDPALRDERARLAFVRFTTQRGQEHWLCACASSDYAAVMKTLGAPGPEGEIPPCP